MDEEVLTTNQITSDLVMKGVLDLEKLEPGSKEYIDLTNSIQKGISIINDEANTTNDIIQKEKDREVKEKEIKSKEKIEMARVKSNEKLKILELESQERVEMAKIKNSFPADDGKLRIFEGGIEISKIIAKLFCDYKSRRFIEDMQVLSCKFEETGTARSIASKRTEKLIDSFVRKVTDTKIN